MTTPPSTQPTTPTAHFVSAQTQAGLLILLLGIAILIAISPFAVGMLGIAVLYVLGHPVYLFLRRWLSPDRAALVVVLMFVLFVLVPSGLILGLVLDQAPSTLKDIQNNALFERLREVHVGSIDVGKEISKAGAKMLGWASDQAIGFFGVATRTVINLLIALLGAYYLFTSSGVVWTKVKAYLPFSDAAAELLRERFYSVTQATFFGTILTSGVQGALIGTAFMIAGLPGAVFWGVVAAFASILPLVGGALVWLPGMLVLLAQGETGRAIFLALWGALLVSNIDNVVRALVFKRISNIHPFTTIIGAFAGLQYFGLLGVLVGPLAITYFFELLRIFDEEYGVADTMRRASQSFRLSGGTRGEIAATTTEHPSA